jgi:hypothetical protein
MKKLLFLLVPILMVLTARVSAQVTLPSCNNSAALENRIDAIEHQGWREVSREFVYINYFVAPTPPYVIGTLYVTFAVDCPVGQACPAIAMLYQEEAVQISENACVWQRVNLH